MSKATTKIPPVSQLSLFDLGGPVVTPATATAPSAASVKQPRRKPATKPTGHDNGECPAPEFAAAAVEGAANPEAAATLGCLADFLARGALLAAQRRPAEP